MISVPQPTRAQENRCRQPSKRAIEDIRSTLDINGPYKIIRTAAINSTDHANFRLVAITFTAAGIETPETLVFLVSGKVGTPPGMYLAGDAMTKNFSVVPRARDTRAGAVRGTTSYNLIETLQRREKDTVTHEQDD